MKIKKIVKRIKKAKKYGKKLNKVLTQKVNQNRDQYQGQKLKQKQKQKNKQKQNQKPENPFKFDSAAVFATPFYSIFASVKVQKDKNTAFLMLGNDISNKKIPKEAIPATDELTIDTNLIVKVKNKD
ncbi:hypothetical protein LJC08_02800 [Methanimicrococcus sp. OttesenSCG-928-J09]|nr:hypothetical protein [Methanimicrococcus sp. OttesenSCG-928-J09]